MPDAPEPTPLDHFRSYLVLLARWHWNPLLQGKLDPSDIAQQALVQAWQARTDLRGQSDGEQRAWLRQILTRCLADSARAMNAQKRAVSQERSLEAEISQSSARLEHWLDDQQSSPHERAERNEQLVRLAAALATLPDAQQQAVTLFHLHGLSVAEVAAQLDRTPAAVGGLLKRGMQTLRMQLDSGEPSCR